jgi:hypothetical protein
MCLSVFMMMAMCDMIKYGFFYDSRAICFDDFHISATLKSLPLAVESSVLVIHIETRLSYVS